MKLWARLALLSITWAEVVLDRPDSQYKVAGLQGGAENCTKLFVQSPPFDQVPHGLDQNVHPRSSSVSQNGDTPDMLPIRAVYYEPRPVGLSPSKGNDLYTSSFYHIHKRDLYIMRNILKANAVRLAPWDRTQDHSRFLQLCRDEGLYVIPSFDLGAFLSEDARRMSTFGERRKDVWEQFQKFTQKALQDARKIEDIILMWTVNFGLNLNETTEEGPQSISVLSLIRDEYFELLRTVRQAQWIQECGPSKSSCPENRFNRPLGIPLLLDTALRIDNVGWYIGFAETTWGTWPADELSLQIDDKTFNKLRPLGAFDVWIAESQPPTSRLGQTDLQNQLSWFNATKQNSNNSFQWRSLSTQTLHNPDGDVLEGCEGGHVDACEPRSPAPSRGDAQRPKGVCIQNAHAS